MVTGGDPDKQSNTTSKQLNVNASTFGKNTNCVLEAEPIEQSLLDETARLNSINKSSVCATNEGSATAHKPPKEEVSTHEAVSLQG